MKCKLLVVVFMLCFSGILEAQQYRNKAYEKTQVPVHYYAGAGIGLDYGGIIGVKVEYLPIKYVGLFAGGGYNLDKFGYNIGISGKILPDKKVCPTITAMGGYNGVIVLKYENSNQKQSNTYYGLTVGAGLDIKMGRNSNKLSVGLLVPFRSSAFFEDYNYIVNSGSVSSIEEVLPVAFSVGFNLAIH